VQQLARTTSAQGWLISCETNKAPTHEVSLQLYWGPSWFNSISIELIIFLGWVAVILKTNGRISEDAYSITWRNLSLVNPGMTIRNIIFPLRTFYSLWHSKITVEILPVWLKYSICVYYCNTFQIFFITCLFGAYYYVGCGWTQIFEILNIIATNKILNMRLLL